MIATLFALLAMQVAADPSPSAFAVPKAGLQHWFPVDSLPTEAKRLVDKRPVSIVVAVDEKGRVSDCKITKSSGYEIVDQHICALATKNARFKPAERDGRPIVSRYSFFNVRSE